MKKIFSFFIIFFCLISRVGADTVYYLPYSDFSSWSTTYIEEDENTIVETERRYKWYRDIPILGDYYIEGDNDPNYPLIDYSDYIDTPYSEWSLTKPNNLSNRLINERTIYEYQDMKEVRYIHLSDFQGSYGSLRISEIEVYAGNSKVSYNYYCNGCSPDFNVYIANGKTIENMSNINNGGYLRIDLNNYYPLDSLEIKLYLFDVTTNPKRVNIKVTREEDFYSRSYAETTYLSWFAYNYLSEIVPFTFSYSNMSITNPEWYEKKQTYNYISATPTRLVNNIKEYQYKDRLYRYYKLIRDYTEEYSKEAISDYLNKDDSMYQDYYRYRKRDKVVFKDELVITDYNTSLSDFIISTTTNDIKIESDLNIKQNGIYDVKYIFPFETITKKVEVNILDNVTSDRYEEFNKEIMKLKEENQELLKVLEQKEQVIKELEENNKKYMNEIKLFLQEYQKKIELMDNIIEIQDNKLNEINNKYGLLKRDYLNIQNNTIREITKKYELLEQDYLDIKKTNYIKSNSIKSSIINNNIIIVGLFIFLIFNLIFWTINQKRSN